MRITLVTVGRTDIPWVREGLEMYVSRLEHYVPFTLKEIPELKGVSALSQDQIRQREGEGILKLLKPSDELVLLDERGREYRRPRPGLRDRRGLRLFGGGVCPRGRAAVPFEDDLLAPVGKNDFCRTVVPGVHHPSG